MRFVILTLAGAALLLAACSDDTTSGTPDGSADMAMKKDGPVTKPDGLVSKPDGPVTKPDMPITIDGLGNKPDIAVTKPDLNVSVPDSGAKPSCKAWDAKGVGMCSMFLGYIWDGKACKGISGCSCGGADCKHIYSSPSKCAAGQAHCGPTPSCSPMQVQGVGACKMLLGWYFDGKQCKSLGGCSCSGADCSKLYKDSASCQAAYKACP